MRPTLDLSSMSDILLILSSSTSISLCMFSRSRWLFWIVFWSISRSRDCLIISDSIFSLSSSTRMIWVCGDKTTDAKYSRIGDASALWKSKGYKPANFKQFWTTFKGFPGVNWTKRHLEVYITRLPFALVTPLSP